MFLKLLILMTVIPAIEIYLITKAGSTIGWPETIGIIIITGILGAGISKREGAHAWREVGKAASAGRLPAQELVEGALVLAAGLVLLTPGFVTDFIGFSLLVRPIRRVVGAVVVKRFAGKVKFTSTFSGMPNMGNMGAGGSRRPPPGPDDPIDVSHRDVDDPSLPS